MKLFRIFFLVYTKSAGMLLGVFGFSFLFVVAASFAFKKTGMSGDELFSLFPGVLWLALLFTVTLSLNQIFSEEREGRVLEGLKVNGFTATQVVLGKFFCLFIFVGLTIALCVAEFYLFFGLPIDSSCLSQLGVLLIALSGLLSFGVLLSLAVNHLRTSAVVLPVFFIPFCLPVVGLGATVSRKLLFGGVYSTELAIMTGFSMIGMVTMLGLSDKLFFDE